jgi:acetoin:2,6-dichlorophenolindophenol oxidoreductase subunit alpha
MSNNATHAESLGELGEELLLEMYRRMVRIRYFEETAIELAASGRLAGSVHTSINQEAAVVGATLALREDDFMTGTHRSHGHPIGKGAALDGLMAELMGRRGGVCEGKGGSMHLADFSVGSLGESGIVGSGVPIAVGAGLSAQVRGSDQVALSFFGDGASNSGGVHESMNLASVWKLPVIFFCENNGFQVSLSAARSTSVTDVSKRAAGYAMPGVTVDGQDPLAVYAATSAAVERARAGEGPSLVEAKTYRTREHAEAIFINTYRSDEEIAEWEKRDPIAAFEGRLRESTEISAETLEEISEAAREDVSKALAFAEASEVPDSAEAFTGLFADPISQPAWSGVDR